MSAKVLIKRDIKQTSLILWGIVVISLLQFPGSAILMLEDWRATIKDNSFQLTERQMEQNFVYDLQSLFEGSGFIVLQMVILVLLAAALLGAERNSGRHDFLMSLPYKRSTIYFYKWFIGTVVFILSHTVSYFLAYALIAGSEFSHVTAEFPVAQNYVKTLITLVAIFSFALFIGTIAGELISQIVLTFIFLFFPTGFWNLLQTLFSIHGGSEIFITPEWIITITLPINALTPYNDNLFPYAWLILLMTVISYAAGRWLYERGSNEHNGEFLMFKQLHEFFIIGVTLCFGLLGGAVTSSIAANIHSIYQLAAYWIGAGAGVLFSYLVIKKVLQMKTLQSKTA
ncbi:ABC transporter permease subunit [Alteribacillus sp. HJP-4]|uniref:ABC transporter permease subunit n=1 Tax=Alteribacillus sp. HJP-4 TaxID=2775394 RepID=UPI0035CCEFA8